MNKTLKIISGGLTVIFALSACNKLPESMQHNPLTVEPMVQTSLEQCNTGLINAGKTEYASRLRSTLSGVSASDLEVLKDKNLTICLDPRLSEQKHDLLDTRIEAVFYQKDGIVGLADSSQSVKNDYLWNSAYPNGSKYLSKLAENIRDNKAPKGDTAYAAQYDDCPGCETVRWSGTDTFNSATISKNPELKTPPVHKHYHKYR